MLHGATRACGQVEAAAAAGRGAGAALRQPARAARARAPPRPCCDRVLAIAVRSLRCGLLSRPLASGGHAWGSGSRSQFAGHGLRILVAAPRNSSVAGSTPDGPASRPSPRAHRCPSASASTSSSTKWVAAAPARVYLSHDPYYGRDVAIKVYNIETPATRSARASRARCSCPRRTWWACCSTRTSCRSTTPARRTATATSSPSTCTARARWRPTAGPTTCCASTTSSRSCSSAPRRCTTRIRAA